MDIKAEFEKFVACAYLGQTLDPDQAKQIEGAFLAGITVGLKDRMASLEVAKLIGKIRARLVEIGCMPNPNTN